MKASHFQTDPFGKNTSPGTPGQWYEGSLPPIENEKKSPVVFIHGLNSSSSIWWEENDMYAIAYALGIKTAFIDLYPAKDMWDNGELLTRKLEEIHQHFEEKLVVVAHSKGGIDTQTALVHFGAYRYVHRLIALSSPYQGAQLADLAYSTWAGWLAGIIGSKNEATYSLQTGYMKYFREETDDHPHVLNTPIYTLAGTGWGTFGTPLYWGGLYLRSYGQNDGAVTVESSRLRYSKELSAGDWNHFEIQQGSFIFEIIDEYLYKFDERISDEIHTFEENALLPADTFLRGGSYRGETEEVFHVEDGVAQLGVNWMSDRRTSTIIITAPDGKETLLMNTAEDASTLLKGSYYQFLEIENPKEGEWRVKASSERENYLLTVQFDSPLSNEIQLDLENDLEVSLASFATGIVEFKEIKSTIRTEYYENGSQISRQVEWGDVNNPPSIKLSALGEGVYNITVDVEGKTLNNHPFNRTIVTSVYVDANGRLLK
ncbi:esterase/lipase family protein [Halobacillus campisalis]|uniref:Esterase/lipase family protein n=1 Tax=Halobacillus campisalis TaxID=435909 RepID=A0ABW2K4W6_9BACI|nr:hypothetical protein [Halobacillus campisalis]